MCVTDNPARSSGPQRPCLLCSGCVAIGWKNVDDLSDVQNYDEVKRQVKEQYPDFKNGKVNITTGQMIRFRFDFKKGDNVLSYDPDSMLLIGEGEPPQVRRDTWTTSLITFATISGS